ncbi:MAG: Bor family protein, partial [Bacteroidales bacterium]|nr:Bor family protein [Bacteroidales bacterium]
MKKLLLMLLLATVCTSCYTTRTSIGDYRIATKADKADSYTYSKGKQCYLFWGLIPLGRTHVAVPRDGHCEVRTSVNFIDGFLSLITGGIFSMQTIK